MPNSELKSDEEIERERVYYEHGDRAIGNFVMFIALSIVGTALWVAFNSVPINPGVP